MYRHNEKQLTIEDFELPFSGELSKDNRWIKLSYIIPWELVEKEYVKSVSKKRGAGCFSARIAFGAIFIKEKLKIADREVVDIISENPYLQYFLGLKKFSKEPLFDSSMMVHFRKRFSDESLLKINEEIFQREILKKKESEQKKDDDDENNSGGNSSNFGNTKDNLLEKETVSEIKEEDLKNFNKGKLLLDATAVPADITYPNDVKLLNDAREKTEKIIKIISKQLLPKEKKPRTYKRKARKIFLNFAKSKKHSFKEIRKHQKFQLHCVERNLCAIDKLIDEKKISLSVLSKRYFKYLLVIREVARQQREMYDNNSRRISDRIVSISQPHIRPIKRGKEHKPTEFGAKISIALVDGYTFLDNASFDNYNESGDLKQCVESYKKRLGFYPASVHADKIYRTKENISYCKSKGIRLGGARLGRLSKDEEILKKEKKLRQKDEVDRVAVEGKFGELKRRYGLGNIMTKLAETTMSVIALTILISNIGRVCRKKIFLYFFYFISRLKWFSNQPRSFRLYFQLLFLQNFKQQQLLNFIVKG